MDFDIFSSLNFIIFIFILLFFAYPLYKLLFAITRWFNRH